MGYGVVVAEDKGEVLRGAVYLDETERAKGLIDAGVDVTAANRYGVTALSLACQNGNEELVRALLESGADANAALPGGETVLMTAARTGKVGPVRVLLEHGAMVEPVEGIRQTALMWAAAEGHAEVVEELLEAGADPDRVLGSGFTAMLFAVRAGHMGVVEILLDGGVDVNAATDVKRGGGRLPSPGTSALRVAVENGHFDLAKVLLEAGADANDARSGYAPLHVLTWVRKPNRGDGLDGLPPPEGSGELTSLEFARLLVEGYGAEVDLRLGDYTPWGAKFGTDGATAFLMAARKADLSYLRLLEELGADVEAVDDNGSNAFLLVSGVESRVPEEEAGTEGERIAVLDWLVERGELDVNQVNERGETAMHGAAYKNVPKVVRWLALRGADVAIWNRENKRSWTPLLIAQGYRPGNFKPDAATIEAIESVMREAGVEVPPAPPAPRGGGEW